MSGATVGFIIQIRSGSPSLSQGKRLKPDTTQHDHLQEHVLWRPPWPNVLFQNWKGVTRHKMTCLKAKVFHPKLMGPITAIYHVVSREYKQGCLAATGERGLRHGNRRERPGHTLKPRNHFRETQAAWLCKHLAGFSHLCHSLSKGQTSGALSGHITPECPLCKFPLEIPSPH